MTKSLPIAFLAALAAFAPIHAGVEGRWVLTEQTYQGGGRNLAPDEEPVRLEISIGPTGPSGRIWVGPSKAASFPWPSIVVDGRPLPVTVQSLGRTAGGGVTVAYSVVPAERDDLVLEIRETFEIGETEEVLLGTIDVRFTGGEFHRGGYTLHRRFERER